MEELHFPIQRTPAMRLLGQFWTGIIPGQILVGVMLFIGLFFMNNQEFSIISFIIFFLFFLPFTIIIHNRLVKRGKKLMVEWCIIKFDTDLMKIEYTSGFPNTMKHEAQEIQIDDSNKDLTLKGDKIGGYHLRLGRKSRIDAIRIGLWFDLNEMLEAAEKLAILTKGEVYKEILVDNVDNT